MKLFVMFATILISSASSYLIGSEPISTNQATQFAVPVELNLHSSSFDGKIESGIQVIASVADIVPQQHSNRDQTYLKFVVHSPTHLCGTQFILWDSSSDRSSVRSAFPLGTIYSISLPPVLVGALLEQSKNMEIIQKQIDSGITPAMISQGLMISEIEMSDLPSPPLAMSMVPPVSMSVIPVNTAEQDAAANP